METKFIKAIDNNDISQVESLLQIVDPSIRNNYAIKYASENGYSKLVDLLLRDKRVDPSSNQNYAIRIASENGHLKVVERLLIDKRVDPVAEYYYAFRLASRHNHLTVVKRLLEDHRVYPSVHSFCRISPIIYKIIEENTEIIVVLKSKAFHKKTGIPDVLITLIMSYVCIKYYTPCTFLKSYPLFRPLTFHPI